jgi:hypothetical protein
VTILDEEAVGHDPQFDPVAALDGLVLTSEDQAIGVTAKERERAENAARCESLLR